MQDDERLREMMMMMMEWNGDGRVGGLQRAKQDDQSSDGHLLMASITLGIPILDLPGTLPPFSLFFYFLFFFFCFFFFSSCILRRTHTHHSPIFLLSIYSFPFLIRPICPIINVTCFKSLCVCDYNQDQQPQALPPNVTCHTSNVTSLFPVNVCSHPQEWCPNTSSIISSSLSSLLPIPLFLSTLVHAVLLSGPPSSGPKRSLVFLAHRRSLLFSFIIDLRLIIQSSSWLL